ncbi:MAG TPA: HAMP domain-containing sensor histidine kinase [Dongiaceae bacterium]|nr:HAMP domain-containing sensor histidine kinase [Dongiaceae bacterium]
MTIRTRLTLWNASMLLVALLATGALAYYELVIEPRSQAQETPATLKGDKQPAPTDLVEIGIFCSIVPAMALALAGGWWVMRRTVAPVTALTQAAEQMNEHNLGAPLGRSGSGDELDRLTEVFNAMTARLNSAFTRLREFTLHASHELKTPLTVMHGELENWLREDGLTEEKRGRVESQLDEVQRLAKIVDSLTLLTKADAGQVVLGREAVRLDELLREALADAESLGRPSGVTATLGVCDPVTIQGDRHRLRQLLLNLCDNAVKYNESGGKVTLDLRRAGPRAEVRIGNTGRGIAAEVLPKVFDPFFRGDASHSQAVEGCGLGLSIARWIVSAHGGTIQIASEPGRWTTAIVRLPVAVHPNQ